MSDQCTHGDLTAHGRECPWCQVAALQAEKDIAIAQHTEAVEAGLELLERIKELEQRNDDLNFRCVTAEEKLCSMEWISVGDRLPDDGVAVLEIGSHTVPVAAYRVYYEDYGYRWLLVEDDEWVTGVTHWMPIPPIEQEEGS